MAYQSPIILHHCYSCNINVDKQIHIKGFNYGAIYDPSKHIFKVQDKIIIKLNSNKYQLEEYHFHTPGEHDVNNKIYDAEVHYVFVQLHPGEKHRPENYICRNVCCDNEPDTSNESKTDDDCDCPCDDTVRNILVIGRLICPDDDCIELDKIQVDVPSRYYMYDGSLTTGNYAPVRWIVGDSPICMNVNEIEYFTKSARPIQSLDGRIVLFSDNY
jgi:carbonic anhydrase